MRSISTRPRDGRVLEELGTYDPRVPETDARAILKAERVDYWLSVGAQPSDNVAVLIKKYGTNGTHVAAQKAALEKLAQPKVVPDPGAPASLPKPKKAKGEAAAANGEASDARQRKPSRPEWLPARKRLRRASSGEEGDCKLQNANCKMQIGE